jgi:hypothetical protein
MSSPLLTDDQKEIIAIANELDAQNAAEKGMTLEQARRGEYWDTCSNCGGWFWHEDGCVCYD